jgi:hypothetical protein
MNMKNSSTPTPLVDELINKIREADEAEFNRYIERMESMMSPDLNANGILELLEPRDTKYIDLAFKKAFIKLQRKTKPNKNRLLQYRIGRRNKPEKLWSDVQKLARSKHGNISTDEMIEYERRGQEVPG